jgi:putative hemolysin
LSGTLPIDEMADHIGMNVPVSRSYKTVAGFLLAHFQHIPRTGENVVIGEWRFEVVDLDGRRIDKVMASRVPQRRRIAEFR